MRIGVVIAAALAVGLAYGCADDPDTGGDAGEGGAAGTGAVSSAAIARGSATTP